MSVLRPGKKIYFISDMHFGIPDFEESLEREKRLVKWLEKAGQDAEEFFLLGDIFDFWFEYRSAVPYGYTRFLGKIALNRREFQAHNGLISQKSGFHDFHQ